MLVAKIEIWPHGDHEAAFEIARVGIANVSQGAPISNYEMTALMEREKREYVMRGEINSFERDLGWEPLMQRAMSTLFLAERLSHQVPYDDPVAQLLRKGQHG